MDLRVPEDAVDEDGRRARPDLAVHGGHEADDLLGPVPRQLAHPGVVDGGGDDGSIGLHGSGVREAAVHETRDGDGGHTLGHDLGTRLFDPRLDLLSERAESGIPQVVEGVEVLGGGAEGHVGYNFSPKLGLIARVASDTELYLHWARAFRSNDARGATTTTNPADGSPADTLPLLARTQSTELGLRTRPASGWTTSLALWQARLASELVFVGDEGVTEARGASRRLGLEWSNDVQVGRDWLIDADLAWSRARFVEATSNEFGSGRRVPNAVPVSASLSANWAPAGRWSSGVKLRYLGAYALEETGTQQSKAVFTANWRLGYQVSERWQVGLDVLNVFDTKANDIEYWGAACTRAEGAGCNGGAGIDGRLVHPMEPRTFRLSLRARI